MADERSTSHSGACRKRRHVVLADLLQGSNVEGCSHAVVAGSCISPEAVKRSRLLSGLGDTEGLAPLPCELSPDEIKLWEAATLFKTKLSLDELVTVLKVRGRATALLLPDPECTGPGFPAASACMFIGCMPAQLPGLRRCKHGPSMPTSA